jgi:hypothetical protein
MDNDETMPERNIIPSVSRGISMRKLKGNFLGIPRLTLGMTDI